MFSRCEYYTMNHAMCPPLCPNHNNFCKKLIELFYHADTVDSDCVLQVVVDNERNHVFHKINSYDLVYFLLKRFFLGITICWPMGDT